MKQRAYNILGRLRDKILDRKEVKKKDEVIMSELYDTVKVQIEALIADYKASVADNQLTFVEAWTLAQHAFTAFVAIADSLTGATGEEKKAVVMKAAERLYDDVLGPLDIKKIPNVFEPTFDRLAKPVYLELVGVAVDFVVKLTK